VNEPSKGARDWAAEMNVVAAEVQKVIGASRRAGLSKEASCLAAVIGALSIIRVDGLPEERILREAIKAVPHRGPFDRLLVGEPS
jgi:hypothetical protein